MAVWFLRVLGVPQLHLWDSPDAGEVRFRYRDTWLLLASLVLEERPLLRETLLWRLGHDQATMGKERLRLRLNDLRHGNSAPLKPGQFAGGIGSENLLTQGATVQLRPGSVTTDVTQIRTALAQAPHLSNLSQRRDCLWKAARLLRGPFLEGYTSPSEGDLWLEQQRLEADRLTAELWLSLGKVLDAMGERRGAFDATRRAYALRPDHPETLEFLLDLTEGAQEWEELRLLTHPTNMDSLLPYLSELAQREVPLTVSEERALEEAVRVRLSQLALSTITQLYHISGFPQAFTAAQAEAICGLHEEALQHLKQVFPLQCQGQRYTFLPTLRDILQRLAPPALRAAFRSVHAAYFYEDSYRQTTHEEHLTRGADDAINLTLAVEWFLAQGPSLSGLFFLCYFWDFVPDQARLPERRARCEAYLNEALLTLPPEQAVHASHHLATLAIDRGQFSKAMACLRFGLEKLQPTNPHLLRSLLIAAHHAAEDTIVEEVAMLLEDTSSRAHWQPYDQIRFEVDIHMLLADNKGARQRFREAWEHHERAFSLQKQQVPAEYNAPALLWEQRAWLLEGLGREKEAEPCWDRAFHDYTQANNRAGMAACYAAMGKRLSQTGWSHLGESLVRQALQWLHELDNPGAVAATKGVLGDVLLAQGQVAEAHALYEDGLRYWQAQKHPRWIEKFEVRLAHYEKTLGKMQATTGERQ